ncbi:MULTISPECIES: glycosyltransferase family 2 protein [Pseudomonas]|uniref:glycosyltransferase family 2 protein n=1 Tax=Pseudomonas TaxID=286 RepID=UPI001379D64A|nr:MULTISPECIES: glycosyltransferase family 2 protein [Pseudomonas]WBM34201.1 glycosyltransferase family 92 protein [Pseudomonas sp. NY11382]
MTIKVKLAAIAKDEAAYIPQWIHHHAAFGFQEIEIWLNNTTDNSIELLQDIQSKHPEISIKFKMADEFLERCLSQNLQFQQGAYSEIYKSTFETSDFSHILFLDLDEFWTPQDFTTTIADFISSSPDADAISFQWLIDTPDTYKHIFSPPFSHLNKLQKNRHVKTVVKLTNRMTELSVHNHIIKDGEFILADGTQFPGTDQETLNKSLVPIAFQKINGMRPDKAFVLHQINRTPVEYLSSLLRGRGHKNDQRVFKANRIGYILDNQSAPAMDFGINLQRIFEHNRSLSKFLSIIDDQVMVAQQFIINRFWSAVRKIRETPELLTLHRDQIRGIKINDFLDEYLPHDQLLFAVDKTKVSSDGVVIEGWAFDALSSVRPIISALSEDGQALPVEIYRHDRPDVEKIYPDAPKGCGFKISVCAPGAGDLRLLLASSGITQTLLIEPISN